MNVKKYTSLVLVVVMLFSLYGCSVKYPDDDISYTTPRHIVVKKEMKPVSKPKPKRNFKPIVKTTPRVQKIRRPVRKPLKPVKPYVYKEQKAVRKMSVAELNENLFAAAKEGRIDIMTRLLKEGARVNATNENDETALHAASTNGNAKAVTFLLNHKADMNTRTVEGWTPLHSASRFGHVAVVRILLARGAGVGYSTKEGKTALTFANMLGHSHIAGLLRNAGAVR